MWLTVDNNLELWRDLTMLRMYCIVNLVKNNPKFQQNSKCLKVTKHLCFKNSQILQLLAVQACNSANRAAFQNPTENLVSDFKKMVY